MGNTQPANFVSKEEATKLFRDRQKGFEQFIKEEAERKEQSNQYAEFLAKSRECYDKKEGDSYDCVIKHLPQQLPRLVQYDICQHAVIMQTADSKYTQVALTCLTKGIYEADVEINKIKDTQSDHN